MLQNYHYQAYGLRIQSEVILPELFPAEDAGNNPDVIIKMDNGKMEIPPSAGRFQKFRFNGLKNDFFLNIDGIAGYCVRNGKEIIVKPSQSGDEEDIRLFLLGSAFGALLHQRGYFVLHASCIELNGKAMAFTGASGTGKSTLVGAFYKKGYKLLTDDVTAIDFSDENRPFVLPGFNRLKLWKDAAQALGEDLRGAVKIRKRMEKYNINIENNISSENLPLTRIYILKRHHKENFIIKRLLSFDRMSELINNTYRFHFLDNEQGRLLHFTQCSRLAEETEIYEIIRPIKNDSIENLFKKIEEELLPCFP